MEMTMLYATKHALSQKDTLKLLDSILPKHSRPLSESNLSEHYSLLLHSTTCTFCMPMQKQHFSMGTVTLSSMLKINGSSFNNGSGIYGIIGRISRSTCKETIRPRTQSSLILIANYHPFR